MTARRGVSRQTEARTGRRSRRRRKGGCFRTGVVSGTVSAEQSSPNLSCRDRNRRPSSPPLATERTAPFRLHARRGLMPPSRETRLRPGPWPGTVERTIRRGPTRSTWCATHRPSGEKVPWTSLDTSSPRTALACGRPPWPVSTDRPHGSALVDDEDKALARDQAATPRLGSPARPGPRPHHGHPRDE